jgi:uncharacterized protein (UPF0264 family)
VAKLLVSVRSPVEAEAALAGGAGIIDVKEPRNGPLGRARAEVWREVQLAVTHRVPVSVALGELNEWFGSARLSDQTSAYVGQSFETDVRLESLNYDRVRLESLNYDIGISEALSGATECIESCAPSVSYFKLGLANAAPDWPCLWRIVRDRLAAAGSRSPAWVAVVYADWKEAGAPAPGDVIAEALQIDECRGVLIDTWDKSSPSGVDASWKRLTDCVRDAGRFLALAGRVDVEAIRRLAALEPDIIAVRGAACIGGDRLGSVDVNRVSRLADAAARLGDRIQGDGAPSTSKRTPCARGSSRP